MPHRTAEVWKRQWADHSEQPDRVYIEARKRVDEEELRGRTDHGAADQGDKEEEEESSDDQGSTYEDDTSPASTPRSRAPKSTQRRPSGRTTWCPVKDEDLRAMALYRFEKDAVWAGFPAKQTPWITFGKRPEVRRPNQHAETHRF